MNFHQVTTLPGTLQGDSFYLVLNGNYCESYVTDNSGNAKLVGNSSMINSLIAQAAANQSTLQIVADITGRDALNLSANGLVLVTDASDDASVTSGAAMYVYNHGTTSWTKVTEFESLGENVTFQWSDVQGRPTVTPAQIDATVLASHTHANTVSLDLLGGSGDSPSFNGKPLTILTTNDW